MGDRRRKGRRREVNQVVLLLQMLIANRTTANVHVCPHLREQYISSSFTLVHLFVDGQVPKPAPKAESISKAKVFVKLHSLFDVCQSISKYHYVAGPLN